MNSPITYHGGSNKVVPNILPLIPTHTTYCEPFAGGASVFFAKATAPINYLNDRNTNIASLYAAMSYRFEELKRLVDNTVNDELAFYQAKRLIDSEVIDFESKKATENEIVLRAWALWLYNSMRSEDGSFNQFLDLEAAKRNLKKYESKIKGVKIISTNPFDIINKLNHPDTFFYINGVDLPKDDLKAIISNLMDLKGKFMLHTTKKAMGSFYTPIEWHEKVFDIKKDTQHQLTMNYAPPTEQLNLF